MGFASVADCPDVGDSGLNFTADTGDSASQTLSVSNTVFESNIGDSAIQTPTVDLSFTTEVAQ